LHFYPGLSIADIKAMDETSRWMFLRFIDLIRAGETWEARRCMASIRAEKDDKRAYLTNLAELAFWNDDKTLTGALEALSRLE